MQKNKDEDNMSLGRIVPLKDPKKGLCVDFRVGGGKLCVGIEVPKWGRGAQAHESMGAVDTLAVWYSNYEGLEDAQFVRFSDIHVCGERGMWI